MYDTFIDAEGNYPRHIGDLLLEHPDYDGVTLPEGWHGVKNVETPIVAEGSYLEQTAPVLIDGEYHQNFIVKSYTDEMLGEALIRKEKMIEAMKLLGIEPPTTLTGEESIAVTTEEITE